ncbi:MAG: GNAT family N-acetyltransferase, partial [Aggregatilineales bacterium]
ADLTHHLAIFSLIAGDSPGLLLVDDPDNPASAMAITGARVYLAGDTDNGAFNQGIGEFVINEFIPMSQAAQQDAFVLYYAPNAWAAQRDILFPGLFPVADERLNFVITEQKHPDWREMLPEDIEIVAVHHIINSDRTHIERLRHAIRSEYPSITDFLGQGFGYCAIKDDDLLGWCLSEYNLPERCEIGIEVLEAYQQSNISTALCAAAIEHALSNEIQQIGAHIWAHDTAALMTLQQLTDTPPQTEAVYVAYFNGALNLAIMGNRHYTEGEPDAALRFLERSMAQGNAPEWAYYLAGCCYALTDKPDKALHYLNTAVDKGWTHMRQTLTDPALTDLKTHPGWRDLLSKLALVQE